VGGTGKGIVFEKETKAATCMKTSEVQAGLGFGIKKFRLVRVFEAERTAEGTKYCKYADLD
jgi:hypothetical protein